MHDGSSIVLKKLEHDYDPTSKFQALQKLEEAQQNNWLITGLVYLDTSKPALMDTYNLVDTPLNRLTEKDLRPTPESIKTINALMF
jgi:2-oxoglutarate ferredoxin oxidoreductase subunit beta